ncbi:MAG: hypothetical protein IKF91_01845 [Bacilli bacterium]|nr:hypothetical protein [Bacilli bacterium]
MKIRSERDKRTYLIIALCAILVVMGVGYAAFSSLLTINGTANISNSWCVGFDNTMTSTMQVTKGVSTGTQPTGSMSYSGTACGSNLQPNSSLNAHFYQPGDEIEYTLTITNKSTVAAAIKSILVDNESVTSNTTKKKDNITYIVEMPEDTTLAPNASTTMKVIAKFQNETDITGNVNGETQSIEVKINAEQDDGNGGMDITPVSNKYTGTIYRWSTTMAGNGSTIVPVSGTKYVLTDGTNEAGNFDTEEACTTQRNTYLGQGMPESYTCQQKTGTFGGIGDYTTDASTLNKTYYLKHDVVDDIITNSYVCFVYNNAEHCMKGADGGASFAANTQIIKDFQTFNNLPDNANPGCGFDSSSSYCHGGGLGRVSAVSDGHVSVGGSSSEYCNVDDDGSSYCNE